MEPDEVFQLRRGGLRAQLALLAVVASIIASVLSGLLVHVSNGQQRASMLAIRRSALLSA
jgi:hypothetical protein